MGFVNFNNQEKPEVVTYTKEMVLNALLETETKIKSKAEKMVSGLAEEVTLNEALALFSSPMIAMPALTKALNEASFEVHYSDGVRAFKKFGNEGQAVAFAKDLIKNKKGLQFVDVFKAGSGFHSTDDTDAIVAFWGDGSYTDNVSKKDAKLAAKKIEESLLTEGDMTKEYDGFVVLDTKAKKSYKFKYIKGSKSVNVENDAIAKLMKSTGESRGTFMVNGFVKKGEWDKSDFEVLESVVTEGAVKQFETDYKEMETSVKRGIGWIDPDYVEYTWDISSDTIDFELVKTEIFKRLINAGLLWTTDHTGEEKGKQVKSLRDLGLKESVNEGAVKQFEMDYKEMETSIKRGIGWIDPEYVADTWENSSDSIDFELVSTELYRRLIKAGLLWTTEDGETQDKQIKSLRELGIKESLIVEGQFSWFTHDTQEQIGSERENTITVYMFDNKGTKWKETKYDGYGRFGGKDYYELLAQMNGVENAGRQDGIDLAFDKKQQGKILFPALVTNPNFNWKRHDFTEEAEHDPNQSWFVEEEDDDYDRYDESKVNEAVANLVKYVEDAAQKTFKNGGNGQNLLDNAMELASHIEENQVGRDTRGYEEDGWYEAATVALFKKLVDSMSADDIKNNSEDAYESKIDEARSIKKIEKDYSQTVADMKATVDKWKAAEEGELKTSLLDKLKGLTTKKRQLEIEMDDAVSLKDIDAELVASESIKLSKAEKWMQLSEKLNRQINEDLRTELKKYIKANEKELNSLADADNWDAIHNMLRTDFNVKEGSKEEDNLFTTFNFVF